MGYIVLVKINNNGTIADFIYDDTGIYNIKNRDQYRAVAISDVKQLKNIKIGKTLVTDLK